MTTLWLHVQALLSDVERKGAVAEQRLRSDDRELLLLGGDSEHLMERREALRDRRALAIKENVDLRSHVSEEEERARTALAAFGAYRTKMEGHRSAALREASRSEARKKLEEKRAQVEELKHKKEALKQDLEDPHGGTVQIAKVW